MCDQLIILRVLRKELNKMTNQNLEAPVMEKTKEYDFLLQQLEKEILQIAENSVLFSSENSKAMASYLFEELQGDDFDLRGGLVIEFEGDSVTCWKSHNLDFSSNTQRNHLTFYGFLVDLVSMYLTGGTVF